MQLNAYSAFGAATRAAEELGTALPEPGHMAALESDLSHFFVKSLKENRSRSMRA